MDNQTESEPAKHGKTKAEKHYLRQIGRGLLFVQGPRITLHDRSEFADAIQNRRHIQEGREDECFFVYWTKGEF